MKTNARASILGAPVDNLSLAELLLAIKQVVAARRKEIFANVNIHALNLAYEQRWFRDFLNQSEVVFCDGFGVKLAASLRGMQIRERITYADMMWALAAFAEENQLTLFFLGAKPGIAEKAANKLLEKYPSLKIVGIHHGYFDKSPQSADNRAVIASINACQPDILILGLGMPVQERWLVENWEAVDARIALTGGAVFDYISGNLVRAPRWMTDHGLEWLGRLIIEPRRLWKRYIIGNPLFFWRIFVHDVIGLPLPCMNRNEDRRI